MKTLIICCSHLYVPATLSYILNKSGEKFVIYTDKDSLYTLFKNSDFESIDVILEKELFNRVIDYFVHYIEFCRYKRKLLRKFSSMGIDEILFFHDGYCETANWLIMKLSKHARVKYFPVCSSRANADETLPVLFKNRVLDVLSYILWRVPVQRLSIDSGCSYNPFLKQSFFDRIKVETINIEIDEQKISDNFNKICPQFNQKNRIVLLQNDHVGICVTEENYKNLINKIIKYLTTDHIYFKSHPDRIRTYGDEEKCEMLPNYVSANIMLKRFNCYIGYSSTVIAEAAKAGILSISLMHILPASNVEIANSLEAYLKNISTNILFPKDLNEFFSIIQDKFK